jgi:zinc and cadmium transporter
MSTILWIVLATLFVSLLSLIGIFTLSISDKRMKSALLVLVGLSAGTLIGGAMLHLLPEAIESPDADIQIIFLVTIIGFILFFVLEKLLWRHCHEQECEIHTFAYLNLAGDAIHNFIDGLIIAASFLADVGLGFTTTMAVAVHEIPQEIGDFGVLVYGGISKKKALSYNFITALTAVIGGITGYFLLQHVETLLVYVLPFAAGGFIYIAAADLVPELHKESDTKRTVLAFSFFLLGITLMWALKVYLGGV